MNAGRLFRGLLMGAGLPLAGAVLLTSFINWRTTPPAGVGRLDLLLELELALLGAAIAHVLHRGCPQRLMEYLVSLPRPRTVCLAAPLRAGAAFVTLVAALLLVHEHSGLAWLSQHGIAAVLPLQPQPYHHRAMLPWTDALLAPLAAFWVFTAVSRAWSHRQRLVGGRPALGSAFGAGAVLAAIGIPSVAKYALVPHPWQLAAASPVWLLLWQLARNETHARLAATATESYPTIEVGELS